MSGRRWRRVGADGPARHDLGGDGAGLPRTEPTDGKVVVAGGFTAEGFKVIALAGSQSDHEGFLAR